MQQQFQIIHADPSHTPVYWIARFRLNCNLIGSRWAELIEIQRIWIANYLKLICDQVNGVLFSLHHHHRDEWVYRLKLEWIVTSSCFSIALLWEELALCVKWMGYSRKVHLHFRGWKECRMGFHVQTSLLQTLHMLLFKFSTVLGWYSARLMLVS